MVGGGDGGGEVEYRTDEEHRNRGHPHRFHRLRLDVDFTSSTVENGLIVGLKTNNLRP